MRPNRFPSPVAGKRDTTGREKTPPGGRRVSSTRYAGTSYEDLVSSLVRTPHSARTVRSSVTPGASSTTSAASVAHDLAEAIHDVVGVRMQSLVDMRHRLDQLGDLYRREEAAFEAQMQQVLARSDAVRATYETREEQLEAQVAKERAERTRVLELMQQFKREGAHVIQVMRENLRAATHRWKTEVERNVRLTAILRKYGLAAAASTAVPSVSGEEGVPIRSDGLRSSSWMLGEGRAAPTSRSQSASGLTDGRIAALSQLIEEQDRIIVELQRRNREMERKLAQAMQSVNSVGPSSLPHLPLLNSLGVATGGGSGGVPVPHDASLEELAREYKALQLDLKTVEQQLLQHTPARSSTASQPPQQLLHLTTKKCEVLERCVTILLQRLTVEQRQRLRVEEQSSRMVSAQDQLVQTLEDRVRELESARSATSGGTGTPRRAVPAPSSGTTLVNAPIGSPEVRLPPPSWDGAKDGNVADSSRLLSPPHHQYQFRLARDEGYEPLPPPTSRLHARDNGRPSGPNANGASESRVVPPLATTRDGRSVASYESAHLVSLEEQLALVTKEFEESVEEWKTSQQTSPRQPSSKSVDTKLP